MVLTAQPTYRCLLLAGCIAALTCCVDPFRIDIERKAGNYVVDAILLDDSRFQYVKLYRLEQENELKIKEEIVAGVLQLFCGAGCRTTPLLLLVNRGI